MNKFRPIKAAAAFHCHRYGIALIWTAIFLLLFILLVGLALDTAKIYLVSHQLQNAADAAALAGARWVKVDVNEARGQAVTIAALNRADGNSVVLNWNWSNDPEGDIVIGRFDPNANPDFEPIDDANANAMKVIARRANDPNGGHNDPIPLIFGPLANVNKANIARFAIAVVSGGTGNCLITLDRCDGLRMSGDVNLDVNDGAIQINADGTCGKPVDFDSCPPPDTISTEALNVVAPSFASSCPLDFPVNPGSPRIPDPLCPGGPGSVGCLPEPSISGLPDKGTIKSGPYSPGYYSGGIYVKPGDSVNLLPGVYILGGGALVKGSLTANEAMLFIKTGSIDIQSGASITLTPPKSGTYEGVAIFQSRSNFNEAKITSNWTDTYIEGTIYFPENPAELGPAESMGNQLIAKSLWIHGNGDLTINYDGRNPAPGNRSYLVK